MTDLANEPFNRKSFYTAGAIAALLQLVAILTYTILVTLLGARPASAEAIFTLQQTNPLASFLSGDFLLVIMIAGYFGTFPALFIALRRISPLATFFATLFTFVAVIICLASESTFALLHLGSLYAAASSAAQRAQYIAAGEAVIASDLWNSTGAYVSGIFMQGGGVIISLVMLRSKEFSKVTAITGLLGNALDLIQHLLHPFAPSISAPIQMAMGPFYLVWFPMLARDLLRAGQKRVPIQVPAHPQPSV
jgi:hypothetical protein